MTGRLLAGTLAVAAGFAARRALLNQGSTAAERERELPGDDLVDAPASTMAVTIAAPRSAVWPWLAQMGVHRAGWYSVDRLDNGGRPSAERVIDALQEVGPGDHMDSSGDGRTWFEVVQAERDRALVLRARIDMRRGRSLQADEPLPPMHLDGTWVFALEDGQVPGTTRLLVRGRGTQRPRLLGLTAGLLFWDPAHVLMQRVQLARLRRRAEGLAAGATRIDELMPDWDGIVVVSRIVDAPAPVVWDALLETDLIEASARDPLLRVLFAARGLADTLVRRMRGEAPPPVPPSMRIGDVPASGPDWVRLAVRPGAELVIGAAGRFWGGRVLWEPIDAETFTTYAAPQRARIAAGFTVRELGKDRSLLRYEARTLTTDAVARRRFRRYWRVVHPGVRIVMDRTAAWVAAAAVERSPSRPGDLPPSDEPAAGAQGGARPRDVAGTAAA